MLTRILFIALIGIPLTTTHYGQSTKQGPDVISARQDRAALLEQVKLQLRTVGKDHETGHRPYRVNHPIWIQILATNLSSKQIVLLHRSSFVSFLPHLTCTDQLVSYSSEMKKRVEGIPGMPRDVVTFSKLPPSQLSIVTTIDLLDWYNPLKPGIYELKLDYRELDGQKIESEVVTFEVVE